MHKTGTFAIHTLGCKVNTYESDRIKEAMRAAGYEERRFSEPADVYIINTCTVTNMADKKSRQMLHRAKKLNEKALVVAAGCYVDAALRNEETKGLFQDASVDLFVGNSDKARIVELILEKRGGQSKAETEAESSSSKALGEEKGKSPGFLTELHGHTRAFLKVQDGCNQFCSYCIIPYVRGRIRTRDMEEVLSEVDALTKNGISEIVLTGIHLSSYGKDQKPSLSKTEERKPVSEEEEELAGGETADSLPIRTEEPNRQRSEKEEADRQPGKDRIPTDDIVTGSDAPLLSLIKRINAHPDVKRIRIGSLEPRLITEAFARELASCEKLCPHFHLSLQSGSDRILKRMNRHYTTKEYRESCKILRRFFDRPAITTDIIVGFPGETEEDFLASLHFLQEMEFYEAHVFPYSKRAGTVAARMEGQLDEQTKHQRSERLIAEANRYSRLFREGLIGKEVEFLAEEEIELQGKRYVTGYTKEYVRCLMERPDFKRNTLVKGTATEICNKKAMDECLILR